MDNSSRRLMEDVQKKLIVVDYDNIYHAIRGSTMVIGIKNRYMFRQHVPNIYLSYTSTPHLFRLPLVGQPCRTAYYPYGLIHNHLLQGQPQMDLRASVHCQRRILSLNNLQHLVAIHSLCYLISLRLTKTNG